MGTSGSIILLFVYFLVMAPASGPMTTSFGHCEDIGVVWSKSQWQLITSIDCRDYYALFDYLNNRTGTIKKICELSELDRCTKWSVDLISRLEQIRKKENSMINCVGIQTKCQKLNPLWKVASKYILNNLEELNRYGNEELDKVNITIYKIFDQRLEDLRNGTDKVNIDLDRQNIFFLLDSEKETKSKSKPKENDPIVLVKRVEMSIKEFNTRTILYIKELLNINEYLLTLLKKFEKEQDKLLNIINNADTSISSLTNMLQDLRPHLPNDIKYPFYSSTESNDIDINKIGKSFYLYNRRFFIVFQMCLLHSKTKKTTKFPQLIDNKNVTEKIVGNIKPHNGTIIPIDSINNTTFHNFPQLTGNKILMSVENVTEKIVGNIKPHNGTIILVDPTNNTNTVPFRTPEKNSALLYYVCASAGVSVVVISICACLFCKKKKREEPIYERPIPPHKHQGKFQVRFTFNKDDSHIRKLLMPKNATGVAPERGVATKQPCGYCRGRPK